MTTKQFYIYIITNKWNSVLYTGMTNNLKKRIDQHKLGITEGFTKKYNVNKLVYFEVFGDAISAIKREKQIKAGPRRRKEQLITSINKEWNDLFDAL
jgi:putative endonuclease